jgi:hypothetical protein
MAANGQLVTADITITWDGVSVRLPRGTVIDVPAGSALATALSGSITALTSTQTAAMNGQSLGPFMENSTGGGSEPSHYQN